jgi:hypothetical protein
MTPLSERGHDALQAPGPSCPGSHRPPKFILCHRRGLGVRVPRFPCSLGVVWDRGGDSDVNGMTRPEESTAALLRSIKERGAFSSQGLFDALYDELHGLAQRVRQGRAGETMSTTVLVHEAYVKLASAGELDPESRLHFFRTAARVMRQILVDAARRKLAGKRGGDLFPVTFDDALHAGPVPAAKSCSPWTGPWTASLRWTPGLPRSLSVASSPASASRRRHRPSPSPLAP